MITLLKWFATSVIVIIIIVLIAAGLVWLAKPYVKIAE